MLPPRCLILRVFAASLAGSLLLTVVGQAADKARREPKSPVAKAVAKARAMEAKKAAKRAKAIAKAPDQPSAKNKTKTTAVAARTTTSVSATKATGGPPLRAVAAAQPTKAAAELDRLLAAEVVSEHSASLAPGKRRSLSAARFARHRWPYPHAGRNHGLLARPGKRQATAGRRAATWPRKRMARTGAAIGAT